MPTVRKVKKKQALWMSAFPNQVTAVDKKRTRIRSKSPARAKADAPYPKRARQVVRDAISRGQICPVVNSVLELKRGRRYGWPISDKLSEIHHTYGRGWNGELLLWEPGWMPVSKAGHRWIHSNPKLARAMGWLAPAGEWNQPKSERWMVGVLHVRIFRNGQVERLPVS